MNEPQITYPLILILFSALAAAACAWTGPGRRLGVARLSYLLALGPLSAFCVLASLAADLRAGAAFTWSLDWLPSAGLRSCFYLDGLSGLFSLLITAIGTLIVLYAGQYFRGDDKAGRFLVYTLLFMAAMLGLVLAGDVITLFIFWEGTSIVSFLLVAYKYKDKSARAGAFKALIITGGGGIALLVGLLLVSHVAGSTEFAVVLAQGGALRSSALYPMMLGLVALGAFTKSAQFPFHIWLPQAMSAPTPASAYLHSATMVKAGIYLMARLNPALGQTEMWFWLLTCAGMATMLTGAYQGLKQKDLKALLAYSTISQLGILMAMIGQDIEIAFKALVIGVLAHALYKSALFLLVGIVDHETGARDLDRLGGLRKTMPYTFTLTCLAALSMAGLPPLFGFLAKETLLATTVHHSLAPWAAWIFTGASLTAGALMLALAARLVWGTFLGQPKDPAVKGHEPGWIMLLAPAVPALLSLILGQLPGPKEEAALLAAAAGAAHGASVEVSLALWHGLNLPLLLSAIAICMGTLMFICRERVYAWQVQLSSGWGWGWGWGWNNVYDLFIRGLDAMAGWATALQTGKLRLYLSVILGSAFVLILAFKGISLPQGSWNLGLPAADHQGVVKVMRIFTLLLTVLGGLVCVRVKKDFTAILALGASGLGVALLMVLEPSPDLALVQIVVDILAVLVLLFALGRLSGRTGNKDSERSMPQRGRSLFGDIVIAGCGGAVAALLTFWALVSRPRTSLLTPFFEENAARLLGSKSVVGAIIVDFRALDTLVEIAVFGLAGLGIYTLLSFGAAKQGGGSAEPGPLSAADSWETLGIGGNSASPLIRLTANMLLPAAMLIGACHILFAHDQPGDGFTAGVIISLGVGYWHVVFGYEETSRRLPWLKASPLIAWGALLAIGSGILGGLAGGGFLANVDLGHSLGIPLPKGIHLGASLVFEAAICLCVLGSMAHILGTLGRSAGREGA